MCDSIKEAKGKEGEAPGVLASVKKIELFSKECGDPLPKRVCGRRDRPRVTDEWREARFAEPPGPVPIGWVLTA
jgi:hypothetical protein